MECALKALTTKVCLQRHGVNWSTALSHGSGFAGPKRWLPSCSLDNMDRLFELFPGAKLGVARVRPMKRDSVKKLGSFLLCAAFAVCPVFAKKPPPPPPGTLQPVNLGSAASFAVLAGTGVTNAANSHTVINGDLGLYPAAGTAITGFSGENAASNCCGVVNGTIEDTGPGEPGTETLAAKHGAASLGIAIDDAKRRPCPAGQVPPGCALASELSGLTITPGVYKNSGVVNVSGPVYLSGNGVYIFQIAGGLIVNGGTVVLENQAQAANVFWVTTQATLNSSLPFSGNILSTTSITFTAPAGGTVLTGRALAQTVVSFAAADTVTLP
jgi:hypothetical protein